MTAHLTRIAALLLASVGVAADKLPEHAISRLGPPPFDHGPDVRAALSPDGKWVATAGSEEPRTESGTADKARLLAARTVVLWDAATGERVREWELPHGSVYPRFSTDGKRLAVSYGRKMDESGVAVFDVASGKRKAHVEKTDARLHDFTPEGNALLFRDGFHGPLVKWNLADAKREKEWKQLEGPTEWVKDREYVWRTEPAADANFIAALIDLPPDYSKFKSEPGEFVHLPPHVPRPTILVMTDGTTDNPLYRKEFASGCLDRFVFSADGKRFYVGGEKVTAFDTATGEELFALNAKGVYSFAVSPDGRRAVTMSSASEVRLWDLETKKPSHELLSGLANVSSRLGSEQVFSADGKTLAVTTNSAVRVFDTATGKEKFPPAHRTRTAVRFSADGNTLFTTCDELRCSWDVSPPAKPKALTTTPRNAWEGICGKQAGGHNPEGKLFTDNPDRRVRIRETATGKVVHELDDDGLWGSFSVFSADAARLAVRRYPITDGRMGTEVFQLFDTKTGKKTGEIELRNRTYWAVPVFSPDGTSLAWADAAHDVHLHDATTGKLVRTLHSDTAPSKDESHDADVLFTPDGERVVVTTHTSRRIDAPYPFDYESATLPTRVFRVSDGKELNRFDTNPKPVRVSIVHHRGPTVTDGKRLAVAETDSGVVRLFDLTTGKELGSLTGHKHGVYHLAFSPDGKFLASGGKDGVVYLWAVENFGTEKEDR